VVITTYRDVVEDLQPAIDVDKASSYIMQALKANDTL
jgi:hypothetical protein